MPGLEKLLSDLKNVNFVKRPLEEESYLTPPQEESMKGFSPAQSKPDMNKVPLKPQAFGSLEDILNLGRQGEPAPSPTESPNPIMKKMKFLNMMNQAKRMPTESMKPLNPIGV